MLLVCPTCEASYQIDDGKIGPSGRTVRCKKCATVWFAMLSDEPEPLVATEIQPEPPAPEEPVAEDSAVTEDAIQWSGAATPPDAAPLDEALAGPPADAAEQTDAPENQNQNQNQDQNQADAPLENVAVRSGRPGKKQGTNNVRKRRFTMPAFSGAGARTLAPYAAFAACLTMVCAVAAREPVARSIPALRPLFAAIGLPVAATPVTIAQVRSELTKLDKADVLIVEGELTNTASHAVTVPAVQIAVRDAAGTEIYVWSADVLKPSLQGGETSPFRARLASPPANGRSVAVRFGQARADSPDKAAPKKS